MEMRIRPLVDWRGEFTAEFDRRRHVFSRPKSSGQWGREDIPWSETLVLLDRELRELNADAIVLQISVTERDIRLDGQLRADARPSSPAVRLLFDSKHGPLTYQCDKFATWKDNVRAIALGLEALRKVARYGITEHGEQYKGWLQIEAAPAETPLDVLARIAGESTDLPGRTLYRRAAAAAHPDVNGGERDLWDQVERAGRSLGLVK